MEKISVDVGYKNYYVVLGSNILDELENFLKGKKYSDKALIISDTNVFPLYGEKISEVFKKAGYTPLNHVVQAGESAKCLDVANDIYTKAISEKLDRKSLIVALGGGVVGDLAGFIASTFLRGVPFIQIPTTLLAAVDSSVGGKVGINHPLGKNLIGAFYQPDAVFIDVTFLKSLPEREVRTGFGEIVKYGIIGDENFVSYLEANSAKILDIDEDIYIKIISKSVRAKADVVMKDEKEGDLRRILNFGHTVGHAVEKETNFKKYNHGEAVAIGIVAAMKIGEILKLTDSEDTLRIENLLKSLNLPIRAEGVTIEGINAAMKNDKKAINGKIYFVLPNKIGRVIIETVEDNVVEEAVKYIIN
ncbi:MAG: 3-dehydroquinate synthase [Selenomonadaceae bacterium]|nr:3-dehydroquinate synthase [Selenomonadaceae bacterium]